MIKNKLGAFVAMSCALSQASVFPTAAQAQSAPHNNAPAPASSSSPALSVPTARHAQVSSASSLLSSTTQSILASTLTSAQKIDISSLANSTISVSGNFVNHSALTLFSSNPNVHSATISAGSIFNTVGASIVTLGGLNLSLVAQNGIYNAGSIISSGTLSMTAPVVANVLLSTINCTGAAPMMQGTTVNINATNILNQGSIQAQQNINISALAGANLAINSLGGNFQANTINISNLTGTIDMLGGDWLGAINLTAPSSAITAELNSISGQVDVTAADAQIGVNSGTLYLHNLNVKSDPYMSDANGNIVFSGITDVDTIVAQTSQSIISDGTATSIIAENGGIILIAGQNINLSGVGLIATKNSNNSIGLWAQNGSITIPGVHIISSGGIVNLQAHGNIMLGDSKSNVNASIDTSGGNTGYVFIASNGSIDLGTKSTIVTGPFIPTLPGPTPIGAIAIGATGDLSAGNLTSVGGDISAGSGATVHVGGFGHSFIQLGGGTGNLSLGEVNTQAPNNSGAGNINLYGGGLTSIDNIIGNGKAVNVFAVAPVASLDIKHGITNTSTAATGGSVSVTSSSGISIAEGITNDALNGAGGNVGVTAVAASGLSIDSKHLFISNNAATDGGTVIVTNYGPLNVNASGIKSASGGNGANLILSAFSPAGPAQIEPLIISSALSVNGSANGKGGNISISGGAVNLGANLLSANGAGTGAGGYISIGAESNANVSGSSVQANGGSSGKGGNVSLSSATFNTGACTLSANGNGSGDGGTVALNFTGSGALNKGDVKINANGANGGRVLISAGGDLTVDSKTFSVAPTSANGNGGTISLSAVNTLTTVGNLNADGKGTGNGGTILLSTTDPKSDLTIGTKGTTQFFARSGSAGGDGGYISISAGRNLTVLNTAVIDNSVRGGNGNGGATLLSAGFVGPGTVTVNKNINVSGHGTGSGGSIYLNGTTDGTTGGVVVNANLTANSGPTSTGTGGTINILSGEMTGTSGAPGYSAVNVTGKLSANGGPTAAGGNVSIRTFGSTISATLNSGTTISANGGTGGGTVLVNTNDGITVTGTKIYANGTGTMANGGRVSITDGGVKPPPTGGPVTLTDTIINANAGQNGTGGTITVSTTGAGNAITITGNNTLLSAEGGTAKGDGGAIIINAPDALSVNNTLMTVGARGNGNGGTVTLTAGTAGSGDLSFAGTVLANAGTVGNGGTINLTSVSGNITPGDATVPVVLGADGDANSGAAGTITITANSGSIALGDASSSKPAGSIHADAAGSGTGGVITLTSNSDINLSVANMSANSSSGQAGTILFTSNNGNITTTANLLASSTSSSAAGNGGAVVILALNGSAYIVGAIHADAAGKGYGGEIYIDGNNDTVQGVQTAKGFFGGVYVDWNTTAHPVTQINSGTIDVSGRGSGGLIELGAQGTILVKGSLIAGAGPNGSAGQIFVNANENGSGSSPFVIGESATTNGITGSIENTGNSSSGIFGGGKYQGNVGPDVVVGAYNNSYVIIQDLSTSTGAGITIPNAGVIHSALNNAVVLGIGNFISLSTPGTLTLGGHLSTNYSGQCCGSNMYLLAQQIKLLPDASITASSLTQGTLIPTRTGTISLSATSIITQGNNTISAHGQTPPLPLLPPSPIQILGQIDDQAIRVSTDDPASVVQGAAVALSQLFTGSPQHGPLLISGTGLTFKTTGNVAMTASALVLNCPIIDPKGTLTLTANGPGGISKASTVRAYVLAHDVSLIANQGNIGSSPDNRLVVGGDKIAFTAKNGSVFANIQVLSDTSGKVYNNPALQLSKANSDFDLLSEVVLKIDGNVSSTNGSVTIKTNPGNLTLDSNITVSAADTVTLQSLNKIIIGAGAQVLANNVSLFAGRTADDSGTISIGNRHELGLLISPGTGEIKVPKVPFLGVFFLNGLNNDLTANNGGVITINGSNKGDIVLGPNVKITAIPIAFSPDAATATLTGRDLQSTKLSCGLLSYSGFFKSELISNDVLMVHQGSCLIHAEKPCTFQLPGLMVSATQESIIFIEVAGQNITVRNLGPKPCNIQSPDHKQLALVSGEEFSVSHDRQSMATDNISRRRSNFSATDDDERYYRISEISLSSLLATNRLLVAVRHSPDKENRRIVATVLKTAAALSMVTANHGAYRSSSLGEP